MTVTLTYTFGDGTNLDKLFTTQLQTDLDQIVTDLNTADASITTINGTITTIQTDITNLKTDFISGIIPSPTNKDYHIVEKIPFGVTLTSFTVKLVSGTITAALKINSTAVTNGSINATSAQQTVTPSALNVASASDTIDITCSANSSASDLSFTLVFTRT